MNGPQKILLGLCTPAFLMSADLTVPDWWGSEVDVSDPTQFNRAANGGQLLNLAEKGIAELDAKLSGIYGAGFTIEELYDSNANVDFNQAVTVGQVKHVSSYFLDRLKHIGYTGEPFDLSLNAEGYPWPENGLTQDQYSAAVVGHLLNVFSWDLTGFDVDSLDTDGDGFLDRWELEFFNSLDTYSSNDLDLDLDNDQVSLKDESVRYWSPYLWDHYENGLLVERWNQLNIYSTRKLVSKEKFYTEADTVTVLKDSSTGQQTGGNFATRMRGYLQAPETGKYRFWVSGRNAVELYLSTDNTKYAKQLIAEISPEKGAVHGIPYSDANRWDQYSSQMSEEIDLVAGQVYFIETLQAQGHAGQRHVSLAWQRPNQEREPIPVEHLLLYQDVAADADDDYLPDLWEATYGLSLSDNGLTDISREGERGDFDADGLTNREEYLLGSAPDNNDTDSDGATDADEVKFYGTDPVVANGFDETLVEQLDILNPAGSSHTWTHIDGGIVPANFRGNITWDFTTPDDGWWIIELQGRLRVSVERRKRALDPRTNDSMQIGVSVDGLQQQEETMEFVSNNSSTLRILTPKLAAGAHTVKFDLNNAFGYRTLQIESVKVIRPGALDTDGDGVNDWLANKLLQGNQLASYATQSYVSPAFIEGTTRHEGNVVINNHLVPCEKGIDQFHWYANLELTSEGPTPFSVEFEYEPAFGSIEWVAWDPLTTPGFDARVGDTLKISPSEAADIAIEGQVYSLAAGEMALHQLTAASTVQVTASPASGAASVNQTINVWTADFGDHQILQYRSEDRDFPGVAEALWVDAAEGLNVARTPGSSTWRISSDVYGEVGLVARLGYQQAIVNKGSVRVIQVNDALANDAASYVGSTPGYRTLVTPIVVTDLEPPSEAYPKGGYIEIQIFMSGVTFLDGTRRMRLYASDIDHGVANIYFRYPKNLRGGYCHYIDVYDAKGTYLGRR